MFIDSITVMLFMASVTVEIGRLLEFDPVPVIIAEIIASNTGGSATMSGDPPNIIIGIAVWPAPSLISCSTQVPSPCWVLPFPGSTSTRCCANL